uniref:septation ring formation regulator EzrA n=1 Tax=uncultured Lactobacillus sp. TaxID=153152 RepID=UPI0026313A9F
MSSAQSIIIILIIVFVIALVAGAVIINKYFNHQIAQIDKESEQLNDLAAKQDISRLEKMGLAGKSLATFEESKSDYQKVETKQIGQLQHLLEQAAETNAKYKLWQARKLIKQAQDLCDQAQ